MTRQELRVFLNEWFCGCGSPESVARFVRDVLAVYDCRHGHGLSLFNPDDRPKLKQLWADTDAAVNALMPSDGVQYFVLYVLTHWDLLEHGGTVGGSWLTEKGKAVLAALNLEQGDGFEALCASACIHGYAVDREELSDCQECSKLNQ
jgi:hypothetical protein